MPMPTPYTETPYTENTFKNSKWTVFFHTGCHEVLPYNYMAFQCPRGVAEDILRSWGLDPDEILCREHESRRFSVSEDADGPTDMAVLSSTSTWAVYRYDSIPYLHSGVWKPLAWKLEDR